MAQLNANIPYINAYIRDAYIYQDFSLTSLTECRIFGVKSMLNRPLLFHSILCNGAVFWSQPISAFCLSPEFEMMTDDPDPIARENKRLQSLQVWDCQSNDLAVTTFAYLQYKRVDVRIDGRFYPGEYMFSIDNFYTDLNALDLGFADHPDAKVYQAIALENGNIGLYPNNMLRWHDQDFVSPYPLNDPPKYRPRQQTFICENGGRTAGHDENYVYTMVQTDV